MSPPLNAFILLILTIVFLFGFYIRNVFVSILKRLMSRQGLDPTDDVLMAFFLIDVICFCFEIFLCIVFLASKLTNLGRNPLRRLKCN